MHQMRYSRYKGGEDCSLFLETALSPCEQLVSVASIEGGAQGKGGTDYEVLFDI